MFFAVWVVFLVYLYSVLAVLALALLVLLVFPVFPVLPVLLVCLCLSFLLLFLFFLLLLLLLLFLFVFFLLFLLLLLLLLNQSFPIKLQSTETVHMPNDQIHSLLQFPQLTTTLPSLLSVLPGLERRDNRTLLLCQLNCNSFLAGKQ